MTWPLETVSDEARRVVIAANPKAGARSGRPAIDQLVRLLQQEGFAAEIYTDIQQVTDEAVRSHERGDLRAVVAAGGDGTAGLVVNRMPTRVPIAVLPLGTENLLSKYLSIPSDPQVVCETIAAGTTVRMDAGTANGRVFLLMVGCGFDAEVVRRLHRERRGNIHHLSYAKPIVDSIRKYQYPELRIRCEPNRSASQPEHTVTARWAFVVNLPQYAGGLGIVPEADGRDGLLDVCTFRHGSFWNGLMYLGGIMLGQHRTWNDCTTQQTRRVRIESDGEVPFQLDGDPGGFLPVDIEVLPERLELMVPQRWASKHGICLAKA